MRSTFLGDPCSKHQSEKRADSEVCLEELQSKNSQFVGDHFYTTFDPARVHIMAHMAAVVVSMCNICLYLFS